MGWDIDRWLHRALKSTDCTYQTHYAPTKLVLYIFAICRLQEEEPTEVKEVTLSHV